MKFVTQTETLPIFNAMELDTIVEFKSSPRIIEKLSEHGISKSFNAGDVILNENAYINAIPIVTKGSIRVIRTEPDGREILLYYIVAGESCIMSFLGGMHQDTSKIKAVVEEDSEILFIPIEKVSSMIREFPEWLDYIFRLYHKRFEELLEVVNAIAFKKMDERLLDFLNKKCKLTKSNVLHITHEQIANELGTVRVVITRLLKQLVDEKVIMQERNKITML